MIRMGFNGRADNRQWIPVVTQNVDMGWESPRSQFTRKDVATLDHTESGTEHCIYNVKVRAGWMKLIPKHEVDSCVQWHQIHCVHSCLIDRDKKHRSKVCGVLIAPPDTALFQIQYHWERLSNRAFYFNPEETVRVFLHEHMSPHLDYGLNSVLQNK